MRPRLWLPWLVLAAACMPAAGQPSLAAASATVRGESSARTSSRSGATGAGAETTPCGETVCWTSTWNPSQVQADELAELRRAAAMVRTERRALTDAEARACAGLDQEERDVSPFYHRDDIVSVRPLTEKARTGKGTIVRTAGARVQFRAVPGLTAERLRTQVDCQVARARALGGDSMPEISYCPLSLGGIETEVFVMGNGFTVEIRAEDAETVEEILRRLYALQASRDPLIFVPE